MLRHQDAIRIPDSALRAAMGWAEWPGRLQLLGAGPLAALLPAGAELWLDGGHNPAAARAVADHFRAHVPAGRPFHLVFGLLANKDAPGVLKPFAGRDLTVHAVSVPGHACHAPAELARIAKANGLAAMSAESVPAALAWIGRHADRAAPPVVLIMGSLYLAGEVLKANGQAPV
jgi:dihydrofolate synthase/folylpolyglutamate synthase